MRWGKYASCLMNFQSQLKNSLLNSLKESGFPRFKIKWFKINCFKIFPLNLSEFVTHLLPQGIDKHVVEILTGRIELWYVILHLDV